jgi:hypothetical protein
MASTKLTRTNGTATNGQKMTFSTWFKIGTQTNQQSLLASVTGSGPATDLKIMNAATHNNVFRFECITVEGSTIDLKLNRSLRDPGAFYNLVIAVDTTQVTSSNRVKIYINGVQETSFATATYPTQNHTLDFSKTGITQQVGAYSNSNYWNGLMSYTAFVDGTAYDASYFGETNTATGIWKIKTAPSVTYGNNGFFLKMDTSSPGTDTSGNSNTFTASGTPTLAQDNASNNLVTLNPVYKNFNQPTFSNGNTTTSSASSGYFNAFSTIAVSTGKWYAEIKRGSSESQIGISSLNDAESLLNVTDYYIGETSKSLGISSGDGKYRIGTTGTTYGSSYTTGDIIGIALDLTNKKLYASKNGAWSNGSGAWDSATFNASTGAIDISAVIPSGEYAYIGFSIGDPGTGFNANFGNGFFGVTAVASSNADAAGHGLFEYAVPTGFYTLNTKNLNTYG